MEFKVANKQGRGRVEVSNERAYNAFMDLSAGVVHPPKAPKSFTRSELIRSIYERFQRHGGEEEGPRLRRLAQAERLVLAMLDEIGGALERGMRVELRGVGVLTVKEKRERQGRNPRTGEALIIDPHRVVRFKASELLLVRLNRPDNRRQEPPKSDPRQLAFPIDGQQGGLEDTHTRPAPSPFVRKRGTRRKATIYEKSE